jgi:hypothetical protein
MLKILRAASLALMLSITAYNGFAMQAEEKTTTLQDQKQVSVTIYNENLALIKELRSVMLDKGQNKLAWREVSARMRPETALLRNPTQPAGFRLLEQNFDFDLLTPQKLLEKYLGRTVTIIRSNLATGAETSETAMVLSINDGIVLKFDDRIETGIPGRITFPGVPGHLRDQPTLSLTLINHLPGEHELELSYLTTGLSWQSDYVAELSADDSQLDLNGLVTLANHSGITYDNARLQLVAGEVHQVQPEPRHARKMMAMMAEAADSIEMKEESLFEYHLYTLPIPTTLADNQTKQVALMSAASIPVSKEFLLRGMDYYYSGKYGEIGHKLKPSVFIHFDNKGEGLGIPLPKGIVRVYKHDSQGNAQFVGEDRIDHTARNEQIRLKLGNAFDITADKIQMDFQRLTSTPQNLFETAYKIAIRNARKEGVTIRVQEPIPGDWTIVSESLPHTKFSANLAEWKVAVPANQEIVLTYRVRVKY